MTGVAAVRGIPGNGWPVRAKAGSSSWVSRSFAGFAMTIYAGGLISSVRFFRGEQQLPPGNTDWMNTVPQMIILAGMVFFLLRRWRDVVPLLRPLLPYLLVVGLCGLSALWSDYPVVTLRRTSSLAVCLMFGIYCYIVFGLQGTIRLLAKTLLILALLSVAAYLIVPSVGYETTAEGYSMAMRGVFSQKNNLGTAMVLGISCYLCSGAQQSRKERWPAIVLMMGCIVMSQSATALIVSLLMIGTAGVLTLSRMVAAPLVIFAIGVGILLTVYVLIFAPELPLAVIDRDVTLTGRLPLWQLSLEAAEDRPLFGYGYYAFWNEESRWTQYIWEVIQWRAPSAHNGFLEAVLEIGIVGLALYVWIWARIVVLAVCALPHLKPITSWILLYAAVVVLLNMDEGTLPYPDEFALVMPSIICFLEASRRRYPNQPQIGIGRRTSRDVTYDRSVAIKAVGSTR